MKIGSKKAPKAQTPVETPAETDPAVWTVLAGGYEDFLPNGPFVVVQTRTRDGAPTHRHPDLPPFVAVDYPQGADAYVRFADGVDFGGLGPVASGENGADLIHLAAHLAGMNGADKVVVVGAAEAERARFAPPGRLPVEFA